MTEFSLGQLPSSGDWKTAKEVGTNSYVIAETGEQVLMYRPNIMAGAILAVFRAEPGVVAKFIVDTLAGNPGVTKAIEIPNSSLIEVSVSMLLPSRSEYVRALDAYNMENAIQPLVKDGFRVDSFKETRVITKDSNQLGRRSASSTYSAHVIDATKLLGISGTVVIIYRTDREKKWGWSSVHDPFSFGHHSIETRVVDKLLFSVISGMGSKVGGAYYLGLLGQKQPHEYPDEWRQARSWLRK